MVPLDSIVSKFSFWSGIMISFTDSCTYKRLMWLVMGVQTFYVVAEGTFFIVNMDNLYQATACMATMSFSVTSFVRVIVILVKNRQLKSLVDEIRAICKDRPSAKYVSLEAEKKANYLAKVLVFAGYFTYITMLASPFINMFIEYEMTGGIVKHKWDLPVKML